MVVKNRKFIFQLLVTLALLGVIIPMIEWKECYQMLLSINVFVFVLLVFSVLVDRWLMAYKWTILLRIKSIKLPAMQSLKLYVIGGFWGEFLPTGLGVEVYRIQALNRLGYSLKDTTSSVVVERVIGFFASSSFALVSMSIVAIFYDRALLTYIYPLVLVFVLPIILTAVFVHPRMLGFISRVFKGIQENPLTKRMKSFYESVMDFRTDRAGLWSFYSLSFLEQASGPVFVYLAALSLGLQVSLFYFIAIVPAIFILLRIPISVQGIGVEEGLFIFFLSLVGVPSTEALSLALIIRMARWTLSLCGGLLYSAEKLQVYVRENHS